MVKNVPCNAGNAGSIPGQGTLIPHAEELLSPSPQLLQSTHRVAVTLCNKTSDPSEKPMAATGEYPPAHDGV